MKAHYRIDSVLCLVDAKNIVRQLERKSQEEGAINEAVQQLAFCDSVIVNKTDLVNEEELKAVKDKITSVNAFAKVVQAEKVRYLCFVFLYPRNVSNLQFLVALSALWTYVENLSGVRSVAPPTPYRPQTCFCLSCAVDRSINPFLRACLPACLAHAVALPNSLSFLSVILPCFVCFPRPSPLLLFRRPVPETRLRSLASLLNPS